MNDDNSQPNRFLTVAGAYKETGLGRELMYGIFEQAPGPKVGKKKLVARGDLFTYLNQASIEGRDLLDDVRSRCVREVYLRGKKRAA